MEPWEREEQLKAPGGPLDPDRPPGPFTPEEIEELRAPGGPLDSTRDIVKEAQESIGRMFRVMNLTNADRGYFIALTAGIEGGVDDALARLSVQGTAHLKLRFKVDQLGKALAAGPDPLGKLSGFVDELGEVVDFRNRLSHDLMAPSADAFRRDVPPTYTLTRLDGKTPRQIDVTPAAMDAHRARAHRMQNSLYQLGQHLEHGQPTLDDVYERP